jgi:hypothetical protein
VCSYLGGFQLDSRLGDQSLWLKMVFMSFSWNKNVLAAKFYRPINHVNVDFVSSISESIMCLHNYSLLWLLMQPHILPDSPWVTDGAWPPRYFTETGLSKNSRKEGPVMASIPHCTLSTTWVVRVKMFQRHDTFLYSILFPANSYLQGIKYCDLVGTF